VLHDLVLPLTGYVMAWKQNSERFQSQPWHTSIFTMLRYERASLGRQGSAVISDKDDVTGNSIGAPKIVSGRVMKCLFVNTERGRRAA
jgi:hypothetical protein